MTITIRLPEELETRLRNRLDAEKTPLSDFVREAIAEKLEREQEQEAVKPSAYELWQKHFKGHSSGEADRAERAEEILSEMFDAKRRRR